MYSDKDNVNLLTAQLRTAGVNEVVVCPGSRNAPLIHNFHAAGFRLYPVTDERSAAFVALGMMEATGRPVPVCVTSGSALLNTLPAVAEAALRNLPLTIISADRPAESIGRLEGQTLPQPGALRPYADTYNIPEGTDDAGRQYADRQLREALIALGRHSGPIHINLPLSEPLFHFTSSRLPEISPMVSAPRATVEPKVVDELVIRIGRARFPLILVGQLDAPTAALDALSTALAKAQAALLLPDALSGMQGAWRTARLEESEGLRDDLCPDFILHIGGNTVHKRLRLALRDKTGIEVIRIGSKTDADADTYDGLVCALVGDPVATLCALAHHPALRPNDTVRAWEERLDTAPVAPPEDDAARLVQQFITALETRSETTRSSLTLHTGNSSSVRLTARYLRSPYIRLRANRGVNGIEGSLSTAVGFSLVTRELTPVVIGDLSFFYDQNALWNTRLRPNLRILLLNNGGGRIFRQLPGMDTSPAFTEYIYAAHRVQARSVAETFHLDYLAVRRASEWETALRYLLREEADRPVLVEWLSE